MKTTGIITYSLVIVASQFFAVACTSQQTAVVANPSDPWGVVDIPPSDPIRIGISLSLGDLSLGSEGLEMERGAQLAVQEFGQISGRDVELVVADSQCSLSGGEAAAKELSANTTLAGAIGPACQSACLGAVDQLEPAHLTTVSGTCGPDSLFQTSSQGGVLFRTIYSDSVEGELAAQFAFSELGARRAVIVRYTSSESANFADGFASRYEALGGTVADTISIPVGSREYRIVLATISGLRPDVIYAPLLPTDAALFTTSKGKSIVAKIPLVGTRFYWSTWFAGKVGDGGNGTYATGPRLDPQKFERVESLYRSKYGSEPSGTTFTYTYDAVNLLLFAVKQVGVENSSGEFFVGRRALTEAVRNTTALDGVTGDLTCTPWGDCSVASLAVGQLSGGSWASVFVP